MKRECRRGELGARELGGSLSGRTAVGALEKRDVLRSRRNVRVRPLRNGWAGRCSQKGGGEEVGGRGGGVCLGGEGGTCIPRGIPAKNCTMSCSAAVQGRPRSLTCPGGGTSIRVSAHCTPSAPAENVAWTRQTRRLLAGSGCGIGLLSRGSMPPRACRAGRAHLGRGELGHALWRHASWA